MLTTTTVMSSYLLLSGDVCALAEQYRRRLNMPIEAGRVERRPSDLTQNVRNKSRLCLFVGVQKVE